MVIVGYVEECFCSLEINTQLFKDDGGINQSKPYFQMIQEESFCKASETSKVYGFLQIKKYIFNKNHAVE